MSHFSRPYEAIIRAAGCRVTDQRLRILDAVCDGHGHTTLGEIYARARRVDQSIDRSTLYRTLKLFVKLGLVVSADIGTGETYYEITKPRHHHHLVCHKCGSGQEIDNEVFQGLSKAVLAKHRFNVETDHLVLFGICEACADSQAASRPERLEPSMP
jgi:Fur family transcriptional regulator, ferric uptake regulator